MSHADAKQETEADRQSQSLTLVQRAILRVVAETRRRCPVREFTELVEGVLKPAKELESIGIADPGTSTTVKLELEVRGELQRVPRCNPAAAATSLNTVKFAGVVYVLHVFQKKSKSGSKTPSEEIDKVRNRLAAAEKHYAEWVTQKKRDEEEDR